MKVCVHTNDKHYRLKDNYKENIPLKQFSITHKTKTNLDALNNRIWDDSETVYWKQESFYDERFIVKERQEKLTKLAFLEPSFETPLVIRKRNRPTADAQIVVNWLGSKDEPYFKSSSPGGVSSILAFAYGPSGGIGGDITMNADQGWWLGPKITLREAKEIGFIENIQPGFEDNLYRTYDPLHTIKHEGGHAIGMRHIENESLRYSAVMFPYYNGLRKFGDADKNYLHDLYGSSSLNHKIKEILLNRINLF